MKFIRHSLAETDDEKMKYTVLEVENCYAAMEGIEPKKITVN